ncbi:MAG: CCA tRNA nucleotidyltransferase [Planctomycetota bacterium]
MGLIILNTVLCSMPKIDALPFAVRSVLTRIAASFGRAWLVGGTVRDLLLGLQPHDFDITTDLPPEQVAALIPEASVRDAKLGAVRLSSSLVITTLRAEASYLDHRHPEQVWFITDPALDAQRRDFTVNAIYWDPIKDQWLDPVGGLVDLTARCLRVIGDPEVRFTEDALRLLRAIRFSHRFDWVIDPATRTAMVAKAHLLKALSGERVYEELTKLFTGPRRGAALRCLVELGFAAQILPAVAAMEGVTQPPQYHPEGDVLTHVAMVLDQVPEGDPVLAWAAVLHDVGKPPTWRQAADRIRFDGHDTLSARMAEDILLRMSAPRELRAAVVEICCDHIRMASLQLMRPRRREHWMRSPLFPKHLEFHRADCIGSHGNLSIYEAALAELRSLPPLREPLISGSDVVALGVPKGPMVGQFLRAVHDALDVPAAPEPDRERALVLLRDLVMRDFKPPS